MKKFVVLFMLVCLSQISFANDKDKSLFAKAKELINTVIRSESIEGARDYTCETISTARASTEGQEGMSALLEKRKASWY